MTRPTRVRIDQAALRSNYLYARGAHGGRALAVLKANAYGHGALACARSLASTVDGFAVAFLDEAFVLREGGVRNPILVLEGCFNAAEIKLAHELDLWLVVHQQEQIRLLQESSVAAKFNVWLKIDTGMSRAGFRANEAAAAYQQLMSTGKVSSITLMTHFARADEVNEPMTAQQIEAFDAATSTLKGERSLCNSAGLLAWPNARRDWGRPGLMLYGVTTHGRDVPELQPVMTFESNVFATRTLEAGESLGYGASFVAQRRTRVGLVCAGYADGYPQTAPTGTQIAVDGSKTKLIGRVSMDMLTVDLTELPDADVGSNVELWGANVPVAAVARASNRSPYELLCSVKRAPLVHLNAEEEHRRPALRLATK
ncbi:alanine racemase [Steroidobacter sp.]|uniref:alanine racemase n=1 Tax=Steroidobacter sp. TaxID=1978227 RepID=UPI001A5822D4|nr:alanine racemase [Steroidobacter sp.]MBL8267686.1 alanine racemase [Steroidobacter sp.]